MKCECSLKSNFQIIGLCDLEKFNEQILKFEERAYSELSLPEQITLPNNFPSIKLIIKTYVNIEIYSSKIVDTPTSNLSNIEGFNLTGKMLLVNGSLEQIIVYIQEKDCKTRHSLKVNSNFSTYIVLDGKIDKNQTIFSVHPYIENLNLIPLSNRVISRSISLFLFAHDTKIKPLLPPPPPPPPPTIEKLPNIFIFKTFDTNKQMAKVEFDKTNNKLIVTSTGDIYNDGTGSAFRFELANLGFTQIKSDGLIKGNENADNFKNSLNNVMFQYGDLIFLRFLDNTRVTLTNYPNAGDTYNMLTTGGQSFIITPVGITPYTLNNSISLNAMDEKPIITIQFDILNERFLIETTGNKTDPGSENYFKLTLYESDATTVKKSESISGDNDASNFKSKFFGQTFEYDDVIKLEYEERLKVVITNFPNQSTTNYNPKDNMEQFQIKETGLIPYSTKPPVTPVKKLPNAIIIKADDGRDIVTIEFDTSNKKLIATTTGVIDNSKASDRILATFNLNGNQLLATLRFSTDPNQFTQEINGDMFEYGRIIFMTYPDPKHINVTNYPKNGDTFVPKTQNFASFSIDRDRLFKLPDNSEE